MIFIPVTRPWSMIPVIDALEDAEPREKRVMLLIDAPGCECWDREFQARHWETMVCYTGNDAPPEGRIERRQRQREMRLMSKAMMRQIEPELTLFIEDDTILPPKAWRTLFEIWYNDPFACDAVSGHQYGRHGQLIPGLWHYDREAQCYDPVWNEGTFRVDACGLYCLMTMSDLYARTPISESEYLPVDICQTKNILDIVATTRVRCGHLLENGDIL